MKIRAWQQPDDVALDPYGSKDERLDGDNRHDHAALGGPLITPLGQTIIINKKRGEVKGKVTDLNTGLPLGADIWITACDPAIPDDFPKIFVSSDPMTGDYQVQM